MCFVVVVQGYDLRACLTAVQYWSRAPMSSTSNLHTNSPQQQQQQENMDDQQQQEQQQQDEDPKADHQQQQEQQQQQQMQEQQQGQLHGSFTLPQWLWLDRSQQLLSRSDQMHVAAGLMMMMMMMMTADLKHLWPAAATDGPVAAAAAAAGGGGGGEVQGSREGQEQQQQHQPLSLTSEVASAAAAGGEGAASLSRDIAPVAAQRQRALLAVHDQRQALLVDHLQTSWLLLLDQQATARKLRRSATAATGAGSVGFNTPPDSGYSSPWDMEEVLGMAGLGTGGRRGGGGRRGRGRRGGLSPRSWALKAAAAGAEKRRAAAEAREMGRMGVVLEVSEEGREVKLMLVYGNSNRDGGQQQQQEQGLAEVGEEEGGGFLRCRVPAAVGAGEGPSLAAATGGEASDVAAAACFQECASLAAAAAAAGGGGGGPYGPFLEAMTPVAAAAEDAMEVDAGTDSGADAVPAAAGCATGMDMDPVEGYQSSQLAATAATAVPALPSGGVTPATAALAVGPQGLTLAATAAGDGGDEVDVMQTPGPSLPGVMPITAAAPAAPAAPAGSQQLAAAAAGGGGDEVDVMQTPGPSLLTPVAAAAPVARTAAAATAALLGDQLAQELLGRKIVMPDLVAAVPDLPPLALWMQQQQQQLMRAGSQMEEQQQQQQSQAAMPSQQQQQGQQLLLIRLQTEEQQQAVPPSQQQQLHPNGQQQGRQASNSRLVGSVALSAGDTVHPASGVRSSIASSSSSSGSGSSDRQLAECVAALELLSEVDVMIAARDDMVAVSGPVPRQQQAVAWVSQQQQQHPGVNPKVLAAAAGVWDEQQERQKVKHAQYMQRHHQHQDHPSQQQQQLEAGLVGHSKEGFMSAHGSVGGFWSGLELWGLGLGQNVQGAVGLSSGSAWHVQLGFRGAEGTSLGAVIEGMVEEAGHGVYGGEPRRDYTAAGVDVAKEVGEILLYGCGKKLLGGDEAKQQEVGGMGRTGSYVEQEQKQQEGMDHYQQQQHGEHGTEAVAAALWGPDLGLMSSMSEVLLLSGPMSAVQGTAAATDRLAGLRGICASESKRQQQVGRMAGRVRRLPAFEHYLQHRRLTALAGAREGALLEMLSGRCLR